MTNKTTTAGRSAIPAIAHEVVIDQGAIDAAGEALPALAVTAGQAMAIVGYTEPYDRHRVVQETRFFAGALEQAAFEVGRRLIVLKEHEPHGEFLTILRDDLGMSPRTGQVLMQGAYKYLLNPKLAANAQALAHLGKTKLIELMAEPDEDIVALLSGGTIAGATLDEIDAMSVRQLKAKLRAAAEDAAAKDELLANKNKRIDELKANLRKIAKAPPNEALASLHREATEQMHDALGGLRGTFRQALKLLTEAGDEHGDQSVFMAGMVGQLQRVLADLREEFRLPDVSAAADLELANEVAQWDKKK